MILVKGEPWNAAEPLATLDSQWLFKMDPERIGEEEAWFAAAADGSWSPIQIDRPWGSQGHPQNGMAWYRTELAVPGYAPDGRLWLLFHAVDGETRVWIDGRLAGWQTQHPMVMWDRPWAIDVTDFIGADRTVSIAVEVTKKVADAGIYKPVELCRQAPEAD